MNVLVTGVSQGLGREIAQQLLQRGHTVVGVSRRKPSNLAEPHFHFIPWDFSVARPMTELAEALRTSLTSPLDALVLNAAAIVEDRREADDFVDAAVVEQVAQVNALEPVKLYLFLRQQKTVALKVAVISSLSVQFDRHLQRLGYEASKAYLSQFFKAVIRKCTGHDHIRIYEFGLLSTSGLGIFTWSYGRAARLVVRNLECKTCSGLVRRPFTSALLCAILVKLPLLCQRWLVRRGIQK